MQDARWQQEERTAADAGPCGGHRALVRGVHLLQEKWVLMIVHSLLGGPVSFNELTRRGSVNTTTLTQRLTLLEQAGLLVKTIHSTMPPRTSYALTDAGLALRPVLEAIEAWSGKYLSASEASGEAPVCPGAVASGCPGTAARECDDGPVPT